jgi:RNA 2',3'-cyclic 3'-phosphodiesterase
MGGPAEERLRLFVAVELPEPVRAAIETGVDPLRVRWPQLRWVSAERWHLTLRFLGEVPGSRQEVVTDALEGVAVGREPFAVRLAGLGSFPSARRTSVLWLAADGGAELDALAGAVEGALAPRFGGSEQGFRPHVTLARARRAVRLDLESVDPIDPVGFDVEGFALIRSRLGSGGPRYEALRRLTFSG